MIFFIVTEWGSFTPLSYVFHSLWVPYLSFPRLFVVCYEYWILYQSRDREISWTIDEKFSQFCIRINLRRWTFSTFVFSCKARVLKFFHKSTRLKILNLSSFVEWWAQNTKFILVVFSLLHSHEPRYCKRTGVLRLNSIIFQVIFR